MASFINAAPLFLLSLTALTAYGIPRNTVTGIADQVSCKVSELCFAIDGSSSLSRKEFKEETKFVELIVNQVAATASGDVKYSAAVYSTNAKAAQEPTTDKEVFIKAIRSIDQPRGFTSMSAGLQACYDQFSSNNLQKAIVLVSDGMDNSAVRASMVAPGIKEDGILISTVGVGEGISTEYLQGIASIPDYFVSSKKFKTLPQEVVKVTSKLCNPPSRTSSTPSQSSTNKVV